MEFEKKRPHEPTEPQLAAMIDVFSILIIFLIAGTVMDNNAVQLPDKVTPPTSYSKESLLNAPQITVVGNQVRLSFSTDAYDLAQIQKGDGALPDVKRFSQAIRDYLSKNAKTNEANLVNFVADKSASYEIIFDVVKAARQAGMQSILFVSIPGIKK